MLPGRERNKMCRVNASAIFAEMVDLVAFGYLTVLFFVVEAMCSFLSAVLSYNAIPRSGFAFEPVPAPRISIYFIIRSYGVVVVSGDISKRLAIDGIVMGGGLLSD